MSSWRESKSGFWLDGRLISGHWLETGANAPRICYRDPVYGWCMAPASPFGRTLSVDGVALARQGECCGYSWYRGGGLILFRGISSWYITAEPQDGRPTREPRTHYDSYGEYDGDEFWRQAEMSGGWFDPWAADGTTCRFLYYGPDEDGQAKTTTVSAPGLHMLLDTRRAPFGRYEDGHWMGAPEWRRGSNRIIFDGAWHGCSEAGGALSLAGGYAADIPQLGGETVADIVFRYAGPDDGEQHADITYAWRDYGRIANLDPEWGVARAIAEASIWR